MQTGNSSGGMQSELNVTPMIDVVLVLLIIFMVVTPKNDHEVPVVVPEEAPLDAPPPSDQEPLVMEVDAQGALALNGAAVASLEEMKERLVEALRTRTEKVVFLEAEGDAPYERAVQTMDVARQAGAKHVGFVDAPAVAAAGP